MAEPDLFSVGGADPSQAPYAAAPNTPAPSGPDISGGYHITKPPSPLPNESEAGLLARVGIAEGGSTPEGQTAVIRAMKQRQAMSGLPIADLITAPGQIEAYWRGGVQNVDPASPAYQKALQIAQTATPSPGLDSWGNEAVIKQRGWGKLPFDPSKGTLIGGQLFGPGYTPPSGAPGPSAAADEPDLFTLGGGAPTPAAAVPPVSAPKSVANVPILDQVAATVAQHQLAGAQSGNAQWPIYDEVNNVYRNKDGSIAALGKGEAPSQASNGEIQLNISRSTNPDAIRSWLQSHPLDPANVGTGAYGDPQNSTLGRSGLGAEQGLANVSNSLEGLQLGLRTNPLTNALMTGINPGQSLMTPEMMRADLARGVMNRNANDIASGSSTAYNLGKFGGEVAGTLPLMAATEGLGGAALTAAVPDLAGAGGITALTGGNKLLQLPERLGGSMLTGARYGAEGSALTSAGSSQPVGDQIRQGAETGAFINPLLGAGGAVARKAGGLLRNTVEPWLPGGASSIADANLGGMSGNAPLDLTEYVPGSKPTFAQALPSDNMAAKTNAAVQERDLASRPGTNAPLAQTLSDADRARAAEVDDLTAGSDPATVTRMKAARDAATDKLRETAFATKAPVDPTPVVAQIDSILASPVGQRDAVKAALAKVRSKLISDDGVLQTDPEQLYGVRQSIDDQLSPLSDEKGARLAKGQLRQIQRGLDPVIETGAPGYRQYMNTYSAASQPINALEYLQSLNISPAGGGPPTLARVNRAADAMTADLHSGDIDAASLSPQQIQRVYNLQADLKRAGSTGPALAYAARGKQITGNLNSADWLNHPVANLAADAVGTLHPAAGFALTGAKAAAQGGNARVLQATANKMANPELVGTAPKVAGTTPNRLFPRPLLTGAGIAAGQTPANKFGLSF